VEQNMLDKVLLKCKSCGTVSRVDPTKFKLKPKCHKCKTLLTYPDKPVDIVANGFAPEVLNDPGIVLVDFWAPTCGYCMQLNPVLEQIAKEHAGVIKVVKVNTMVENVLPSQFGVQGIRSLLLYKDGKMINRTAGFMPKEQLVAWILGAANG